MYLKNNFSIKFLISFDNKVHFQVAFESRHRTRSSVG